MKAISLALLICLFGSLGISQINRNVSINKPIPTYVIVTMIDSTGETACCAHHKGRQGCKKKLPMFVYDVLIEASMDTIPPSRIASMDTLRDSSWDNQPYIVIKLK